MTPTTERMLVAWRQVTEIMRDADRKMVDSMDRWIMSYHSPEELYEEERQPPRLVCRGHRGPLDRFPAWPCDDHIEAQRRIDARAAARHADIRGSNVVT